MLPGDGEILTAGSRAGARGISRRVLLAAAAAGPLSCKSRSRSLASLQADTSDPNGGKAFGGLQVAQRGDLKDDERGGAAVVLLHGWGAPGDDLIPLAQDLARPRTRFFLPEAPLAERGGGRAWWHLDAADRPAHAGDGSSVPAGAVHPQLLKVRLAVQGVVRTIRERFAPETLRLVGFSQGAMLALDVAVQPATLVDGVAALSGLLLVDSLPALRGSGAGGDESGGKTERKSGGKSERKKPAVLIAHGREDQVVPFRAGERAKEMLEGAGYAVTWRPFAGGHEIPERTIDDLRAFLFGGA